MRLNLFRLQYLPTCTKGVLYLDSELLCFTLEPPLKFNGQLNVRNKTCVPQGAYLVLRWSSQRFGRIVPLVNNVPNREGVEIHPLNLPSQTEGCIGVGMQWINAPEIGQSDVAFDSLMGQLNPDFDNGVPVSIAIQSLFEVPHV